LGGSSTATPGFCHAHACMLISTLHMTEIAHINNKVSMQHTSDRVVTQYDFTMPNHLSVKPYLANTCRADWLLQICQQALTLRWDALRLVC
jgi:hypothetical protein